MRDRRMVGDKVENDFELSAMRFLNEAVESFERAEDRINPAIISDIIAEIMHGRGIDRRNPDRVDAEPEEIVQPPPDPVEIADAIAVRNPERTEGRFDRSSRSATKDET